MGGHIRRRVTVLAPRPERRGRPAALEGVVGRLEAKVRLEEPRVLCPPPDERLVVPVGQHRGHGMSGALAHYEQVSIPWDESGSKETAASPAATQPQPAGWSRWATAASRIGGRPCRRHPLLATSLADVRRLRKSLVPLPPRAGGTRRHQVGVGQEGHNAPVAGYRRRVPPAVMDRLHQRRGVAVLCVGDDQHPVRRHESVKPPSTSALRACDSRPSAGGVDDRASADRGPRMIVEADPPMVTVPPLSGHPGARAYANAEGPEPVVKGLFERRPVHMPSMPERVVHELGRLDVGRAPGAAVAEEARCCWRLRIGAPKMS